MNGEKRKREEGEETPEDRFFARVKNSSPLLIDGDITKDFDIRILNDGSLTCNKIPWKELASRSHKVWKKTYTESKDVDISGETYTVIFSNFEEAQEEFILPEGVHDQTGHFQCVECILEARDSKGVVRSRGTGGWACKFGYDRDREEDKYVTLTNTNDDDIDFEENDDLVTMVSQHLEDYSGGDSAWEYARISIIPPDLDFVTNIQSQ